MNPNIASSASNLELAQKTPQERFPPLKRTTTQIGLKPTSYDQEFEMKPNLRTAKHVDGINITGLEDQIHKRAQDSYTIQWN